MQYAMILAGGSGTRLWPVSRRDWPKQLAKIIGERSLLDIAIDRARAIAPPGHTMICASAAYLDAIKSSAPDLPDDLLVGEPIGRDTLCAIGLAAAVLERRDPDAVFAVLTADHLIEPMDVFANCVRTGFELVEESPDRLVTFSITPTRPATGFGYVHKGEPIPRQSGPAAHRVKAFVEKPDIETARRYVESGEYGWNSGMFVWRAGAIGRAIEQFTPETYAGLWRIAKAWGTGEQRRTLETIYPTLEKVSVDYAVMEPASRPGSGFEVCTVEMDLDWRDVGSWPSFARTLRADAQGVRLTGAGGGATVVDSAGALIVNDDPDHHIAVMGVRDLVIVHTRDATLVMAASEAERLKELHALVPDELR